MAHQGSSSEGLSEDLPRSGLPDDRVGFDGAEIAFHWLTVLLVVSLYLLAQFWSLLTRGTPLRHTLQSWHVSLGLLFTVVVVLRVAWRLGPGRRVPPATHGLMQLAATIVEYALYALLVAMICLGFSFRWAQREPLSFFGLFEIPALYPFSKNQAAQIGKLHETVANVIMIVAGLHALAALFHHFVLRDSVLLRMLPRRHRMRVPSKPNQD